MLKHVASILASAVLLSACGQQQVADPSAAQEQAALAAYNDLKAGQFDAFLAHLTPDLQKEFQDNPKVMKKFSYSIPDSELKSKTLMVKSMVTQTNQPSEFKVSYEMAYPKNLVQYDVSFDKPNGSPQIQNFNIRVYGE